MTKDANSMAREWLNAAKAKGYDTSQVNGLLDTPEAKTLLNQLNGPGGGAMKDAASRAAEGDTEALSSLLRTLTSTPEGKAVIQKAMSMRKA